MHDEDYVWLGSKRAIKRGVGNKGALLDKAANVRLPVPAGIVLLDATYQKALDEELIRIVNGEIDVLDPAGLHHLIIETNFTRPVAVRSAFSAEDSAESSMAGHFESVLSVDAGDPAGFSHALATVWESSFRHTGDMRRDVLILEMVEAKWAGVAFTERAYQDDLINFTEGLADSLVSGEVAGQSRWLPKLQLGERSELEAGTFSARLQKLLRGVRRTFGEGDWDIEWADDGEICWLIQVRPVTRPTRRNETFTNANLKEVLPNPPSYFMGSVIVQCTDGMYEGYRQYDSSLPTNRPLVEIFAGRPYFNLTLLSDTMRTWGLPTRLVTDSIGGEIDVDVALRPGRVFRKSRPLLHQMMAYSGAVRSTNKTIKIVLEIASRPGHTFTTATEQFKTLFVTFIRQMSMLTAAMSGSLAMLRRAGTLAEHNAQQLSRASQMFADLQPLRALVQANPALKNALADGHIPADSTFQEKWTAYLAEYGHRAIYETDIARPRYHEAPEPLLASLLTEPPARILPPPRTWRGRLTAPLWWYCGGVLHAREEMRYQAMRGYDQMRQRFLGLADKAVEKGQLPGRDSIWLLTVPELQALDGGAVYNQAFIETRQAEFDDLKVYRLPDLIRRFDDLEQYRQDRQVGDRARRLSGISLTDGDVSGRAWVLTEPALKLPPDFEPSETILVASSVDAGWIPVFSQVAGVVVETGGDLSHGSIILREIGLPAITNVTGATHQIQTGEPLRLQAGSGVVRRVGDTEVRRGAEKHGG